MARLVELAHAAPGEDTADAMPASGLVYLHSTGNRLSPEAFWHECGTAQEEGQLT